MTCRNTLHRCALMVSMLVALNTFIPNAVANNIRVTADLCGYSCGIQGFPLFQSTPLYVIAVLYEGGATGVHEASYRIEGFPAGCLVSVENVAGVTSVQGSPLGDGVTLTFSQCEPPIATDGTTDVVLLQVLHVLRVDAAVGEFEVTVRNSQTHTVDTPFLEMCSGESTVATLDSQFSIVGPFGDTSCPGDCYGCPPCVVSVEEATWGAIKVLYR